MQSTRPPAGFTRDSGKFRGGMRAAQAVLRVSKAEFAAEMAALSATVARRIQQSRDLLDAQSSLARETDNPDRINLWEPNPPSRAGGLPHPASPLQRHTPVPIP